MRVFISWSGPQSEHVAKALRDWLPNVVFDADPFVSAKDIRAGAFWDEAIRTKLKDAKFAIACVTAANQTSAWLNYEVGAMVEGLGIPVAPYLVGLTCGELQGPLTRLMAKECDRESTWAVVESLWKTGSTMTIDQLRHAFSKNWDELEEKIKNAPTSADLPTASGAPELGYLPRTLDDESAVHVLEEHLDYVGDKTTIIFADVEKKLRLPPGTAHRLLKKAAKERFDVSIARDAARVVRRPMRKPPRRRGTFEGGGF